MFCILQEKLNKFIFSRNVEQSNFNYIIIINNFVAYLVLAISTGIEAAVVTKPEIIELAKCSTMFSSKYPNLKKI